MNDITLQLIIKAVDLATKDIDGIHGHLRRISEELAKNEYTRSAEGMKAFSDAVKDGTQPMADAAKNALALSAAITGITSYLASQAYQSAVDYESAMSDLAKVLDGGMESAKTYGQQLNELALRYGQNGEQLLQAMANFKQAGFETNDAFRLVEESLKLMIAGDLDAAASSTQLVSILKGFKAPVSEAGHVVDALNEVSNRYATDVKKLAEGMAAISPIAKQMGFSIDETAGLLTPIIEVFQSGSEAADTLKTGLQRLTDQSDPVKDALASIGVSQLDLNGQLRAGKDIFLDVAKAMTGLDSAQQQYVVGQLVGIEQAGRMGQVFNNLATYLGVTQAATDSAGSALNEVNVRLQTSEAQNDRATESFRQLATTIGTAFKPQITGVIAATGDLAQAFDHAIKAGDFAPLLNVLKPQIASIETLIQAMAENLDDALAEVDWTPLVTGLKSLSGEFGETFAAFTSGMNLMTKAGLQEFLQRLINLLGNFSTYLSGVLDGLEPFIDGLNGLFKVISTDSPKIAELVGELQGLSLTLNQGLPILLEWGSKIFGVVGFVVEVTVKIGLFIGALKLLNAAGIPVGAMLSTLVARFLALNPAVAGAIAALAGMPGLVLGLAGAAGGLGVALGTVVNKTVEWVSGGQSLGTLLYDWTHGSEDAARAFSGLTSAQQAATKNLDEVNRRWSEGVASLNELNDAQERYKAAFHGLDEQQVAARERIHDLSTEYVYGKIALEELTQEQQRLLDTFIPLNAEQQKAKEALDATLKSYRDGKSSVSDLGAAQSEYLATIDALIAAKIQEEKAARNATQSAREQAQADQDAEEWAKKAIEAGIERTAVINQQALINEKLKASFAAMGLVYDELSGKILHQNEQTAAQIQAQRELGLALDKIGVDAGVMSERITAAGQEMMATFNQIVANSQVTSEQITAAFLAMIPKAETNAELEAIRSKINELAEQGKITGEQVSVGLQSIKNRAQEVAKDSAFGVIQDALVKIREETTHGIEVGEQERASLQTRIQSAIELAKAKGDEAEAARLSAVATQEELSAAQARIQQYARQQTEIDGHIQKLYAQAQADGVYTDAERKAIEALQDKAAALGRDKAELEARLPLLQREADQAEKMAGPIGNLINLYNKKAVAADYELNAVERANDETLRGIDAEIQIAEAKGDTAKASKLKVDRLQAEADAAQEEEDAIRRRNQAEIDGLETQKLSLAASEMSAEAKEQEVARINDAIAAKEAEIKAAQATAESLQNEADAAKKAADETAKSAEETAKAGEETAKAGNKARAASVFWSVLSDAAYDALRATDGMAFSMGRFRETVEETGTALELQAKKVRQNSEIFYAGATATSMARREIQLKKEVLFDYAKSLETASYWLELLNKKTRDGTVTMADLRLATRDAEDGLKYLDQEHLDNLRAAIEAANNKLREMQEETQSAQDRLAELNAELLEAQGADEKAKLLRQQLDYQQALAEIEKQRNDADLAGNRDLIAILDQQKTVLDQINKTKVANIQADAAAAQSAEKTAAATKDLGDQADRLERIAGAMQSLAKSSIGHLVEQSAALNSNFSALDRLL